MTRPDAEHLELEAILDTMADGLYVVDRQGVITRWNRAMERLTGYTQAEAVGQSCALLRCDGCPETPCRFDVAECGLFERGAVDHVELRIVRKDGRQTPVLKSARVLRGADGAICGAVETLTDLSAMRQLESEVAQLRAQSAARYEFHNLVGRSAKMQEVFSLAELAAASQVTVLLQGPTGSGKELVAKAIHFHSARKDGPFIAVNCAALSESLLESELFGHARGAFTGAVRDHEGRFERADGGTIFLDEIGEITPLVQVKLLRVLQERAFERVGEAASRSVDVRVIAATHRNLLERVREGAFREDLYYRLKVFPLHLPPLRERKEDIALLVDRFVRRFNDETGKRIEGLNEDALRIVMDYCWPGNVRELENAVEHAFVVCPGGKIGPFDLPVEIRRVELRSVICPESGLPVPPMALSPAPRPFAPAAKPASREELEAVLDACGWNKAEAARRLGVTRTTVWRRMKALGMPLERPG